MKQGNPIPALIRKMALAQACLATLAISSAQAQQAPAPASQTEPKAANVPVERVPAKETAKDEEVIQLSPFEVAADNKGYYQASSMSGTRFNTKIEDLASSLTVVTKEQMADFAMLDINDVFMYTASAEGSGTYTAFAVDRNGSVSDSVQLSPTSANRIRGLTAANISIGNMESIGVVPVDPLWLESVEVSRGPNANVFGLGNPSGTVNLVPVSANTQRNKSRVELRMDSYDGYRSSLDVNRVLFKNKLAVRASTAFQHEGFERKPSGVNTVRHAAMVKYQPFKSTTISASTMYYRMNGNRPNFSPPRDSISYWIKSGKPTWDPVAQVIHLNGQTYGPYTKDSAMPYDFFTSTFTGSTRSQAFVNPNGTLGYWGAPVSTVSVLPLLSSSNGTNANGTYRYMAPSPAAGSAAGKISSQPLFMTTPSVSDKNLYDWDNINIAATNRVMDKVNTSYVNIDQFFINTPMHLLVGNASFMREDVTSYKRNLIGVANDNGQSGQLLVDVNERTLDGSPNPYFLRPYIGTDQPRTTWEPAKWDTYRGQLAYKIDLTQSKGMLKWFGTHQLNGYYEYKYRINKRYSYRDAITNDLSWIPAQTSRGDQGSVYVGNKTTSVAAPLLTRSYFRYYVGDGINSNVDYAPGNLQYGTYRFAWGGPAGFNYDNATLGQVEVASSSGAGNNVKRVLKTKGGVIQSNFLNSAIVTTFGLREDYQYVVNGSSPVRMLADGQSFDDTTIDHWATPWRSNSGKTKTGGAVVRPFRDLPFLKGFENSTGFSSFAARVLRGMSWHYNKSDSFIPQEPRVNLYLQQLPNSTGEGKDWGFSLNLSDKFVLRFNRFNNKQLNDRNGDASTIAQRVLRCDIAGGDAWMLADNVTKWLSAAHPDWSSTQVETELAKVINMPTDRRLALRNAYDAGQLASTNDTISRGTEVEINYNPTNYWTMVASFTDIQAIRTNVSNDIQDYINERMPYWTSIRHELNPANALWRDTIYSGSQTPAQNFVSFVESPYSVLKQLDGKANPQVRRYQARVSTNVQLAAFTSQQTIKKMSVGGAVRWEDRGAIGYYGVEQLPAVIKTLDVNRPIYDGRHTYVDLFVSYKTKMFSDRVNATFRLNVQNIQEGGRLQPIGAYPDGTAHTYRIVDPRKFILTASFDI